MPPPAPSFKTIVVDVDRETRVGTLRLNRPRKSNALDPDMWREIPLALDWLDSDSDVRVVLLSGAGKNFCAGIDVSSPELLGQQLGETSDNSTCAGRKAERMFRHVSRLQESFTAIERCRAPVVCAVQGACFGGGVDLAVACDIRICSVDSKFCVKEVDLAIIADIGTLQRLPKLIGHGRALELGLTARVVGAEEAHAIGLVSAVSPNDALLIQATRIATQLASKSPLAIQGTKLTSLHARDHSIEEGLKFVAHLNAARLQSLDLSEAMAAKFERRIPKYAKL